MTTINNLDPKKLKEVDSMGLERDNVLSNYCLGIDVSFWDDDNSTPQPIDFAKAYNAGARFVFIKASQRTYVDEDFLFNWKNAKAAGFIRGAYHFLVWDVSPEVQARYFYSLLKSDMGELPPVCDFEWWKEIPEHAFDYLDRFLNEFNRLSGKECMIYTSWGFWRQYGENFPDWGKHWLWTAQYEVASPTAYGPWEDHWTFWQFTSKGDGLKYGAESKELDINYFHGTYEQLCALVNFTPPQPPVPPTPPPPQTFPYAAIVTAAYGLNLRKTPEIVPTNIEGGLQCGVSVSVLEEKNGFGRINGWASLYYLKKI